MGRGLIKPRFFELRRTSADTDIADNAKSADWRGLRWQRTAQRNRARDPAPRQRAAADIVVVELERELLSERQGMEAVRSGKGPVDQRIQHAMVQHIEGPDVLAGMRDFGGDPFERPGHAGEIRLVVDGSR